MAEEAAFTKLASDLIQGPSFCSADQQVKVLLGFKEADVSGFLTLPPSGPKPRLTERNHALIRHGGFFPRAWRNKVVMAFLVLEWGRVCVSRERISAL